MFLSKLIRAPKTLAARLTFWYSAAFYLLLLVSLVGMFIAVSTLLETRMENDLREDIEEFNILYQQHGLNRVLFEINQEIMYENPEHFFIRLFNSQGELLLHSDLSQWRQLPTANNLLNALSQQKDILLKKMSHIDEDLTSYTAYGKIGKDLIMHTGESNQDQQETLDIIKIVSAIIFCIIIPIGALIGWLTARKAVSGIKAVSAAAADIEQGIFDRQVSVNSKGDEIDELANTFNAMADRINTLIEEMREMTDNIAHDLRSPLARIRAISESTLSSQVNSDSCHKAASDTLEECDRLLQMINMTLDVAEAEADVRETKVDLVDLNYLTEDACELFSPVAEHKNIKLSTHLSGPCTVQGNKHNLQRMLTNLIDNALKYTPEKGEVIVELENEKSDAILKVADTGIGIPEPERSRIFDRFYRCDQSRTQEGCGLGLCYSRAVARSHGGDIKLKTALNRSSVFEVSLPLSK